MKITCIDSGTEYNSKIVGDAKLQLEDCINWLATHLKARYPKVLSDLGIAAQMALAAGMLAHAEPDDSEGGQLWNKVQEEHQAVVLDCLGIELANEEEEEEEEAEDAYIIGFTEGRDQISAWLADKGYPELADEVKTMEIQREEDKADDDVLIEHGG